MISILKGTLIEKLTDAVVIECGGIGYLVKVPLSVSPTLPELGNEVLLYTTMITSKTDISLIGFVDEQQRVCFQHLTSVSGCGVKVGLALLGSFSPGQLYRAIAENNDTAIAKVKGVSKKTAQRIVLELKEKIKTLAQEELPVSFKDNKSSAVMNDSPQMAIAALVSLGFKRRDAENAVSQIDPTQTVEQIISVALRNYLS